MKLQAAAIGCLLLLLFGVPGVARSGPLQAPAALGAVIESWNYEPNNGQVTVRVLNASHKDITGYTITSDETFSGHAPDHHEITAEFVGTLVIDPQLFHPGEVRTEIVGVFPNLQKFTVEVSAIAYADGTTETTKPDVLGRLVERRQVDLKSRQIANQIIKDALANSADPHPQATALAKIQARIDDWNAKKHSSLDLDTRTLSWVVEDLQHVGTRDDLAKYLTKSEQDITTLTPHANPKNGGKP